jgi:hypothetical protein
VTLRERAATQPTVKKLRISTRWSLPCARTTSQARSTVCRTSSWLAYALTSSWSGIAGGIRSRSSSSSIGRWSLGSPARSRILACSSSAEPISCAQPVSSVLSDSPGSWRTTIRSSAVITTSASSPSTGLDSVRSSDAGDDSGP